MGFCESTSPGRQTRIFVHRAPTHLRRKRTYVCGTRRRLISVRLRSHNPDLKLIGLHIRARRSVHAYAPGRLFGRATKTLKGHNSVNQSANATTAMAFARKSSVQLRGPGFCDVRNRLSSEAPAATRRFKTKRIIVWSGSSSHRHGEYAY